MSDLPEAKLKMIGDSATVIEKMDEVFPIKVARRVPYIALDQASKIQAIALVRFARNESPLLDFLVTCPDNIALLSSDVPFRGAGTAIIVHLAREIAERDEYEGLFLEAVESAQEFYENLWFTPSTRVCEYNDTRSMVLARDIMKDFAETYGDDSAGIKEPDLRVV